MHLYLKRKNYYKTYGLFLLQIKIYLNNLLIEGVKMIKLIKEQIKLIKEKDPAVNSIFEVLLYPSLKVQIYYKISHYLYLKKNYF